MSDAELRALERALRESGAPEARIRYAETLERVRRVDDALDVLLEGCEDAGVRARIGRLHVSCFASFDGPPRLVWKQEWPGGESETKHGRSYDRTDHS